MVRGKPVNSCLMVAAGAGGGFQPGDCEIADYAKDILPAKAAGLRTVWYCPQSDRREPNEADAVITDMHELIRALSSLENS